MQIAVGKGLIVATGLGFTVTNLEAVAEQLFASMTVTLYVVLKVGETVITEVVAELSHRNEVPPLADRVMSSPSHISAVAGEMVAPGIWLTVTKAEAVPVHPLASVAVTE